VPDGHQQQLQAGCRSQAVAVIPVKSGDIVIVLDQVAGRPPSR